MAKHRLGHRDAREWYDRAVAWMEKHKSDDEDLRRLRAEAGETAGDQEVAAFLGTSGVASGTDRRE